MKAHDRYAVVVERHTLGDANTITIWYCTLYQKLNEMRQVQKLFLEGFRAFHLTFSVVSVAA